MSENNELSPPEAQRSRLEFKVVDFALEIRKVVELVKEIVILIKSIFTKEK